MDIEKLKRSPAVMAVLVVITIASFYIGFHKSKDTQQMSVMSGGIQASLGQIAADETAKVLGDTGGKVLAILGSPGVDPTDPSRAFRAGFEAGLKRHPKLALIAVEIAPYSRAGSENEIAGPHLVYFQRILEKYPMTTCFVSFMQAPNFNAEEFQQWDPAKMPKLLSMVMPIDRHPWRSLLRQGIAQALFVSTNPDMPKTAPSGTYQEIAAKYYTVITTENLDQFARLAGYR